MSSKRGWTTWDPSSMAIWEHLPSGLRCHLVLQDAEGHELTPTTWTPLEEVLPTDNGMSLAHLMLQSGDARVEIECGGEGDVAACRIWRVEGDSVTAHWEVEGQRDGWQVHASEREVAVAPRNTALPADVPNFLRTHREVALMAIPRGGERLAAPLEAMEATLAANTITLPETGELVTISRHTAEVSGGWRIENWHTFLTALGIAYVDPAVAVANCLTALRALAAGGMLAAESTARDVRADISNPPVAAYCVWKIFQMTGDFSLLNKGYPILLRWHDWWRNSRDGNMNTLLSWSSSEETGMPGHPLYEETAIDDTTGLMRLDDVGLSSLWALDAFALMRMALQLNDLDQATHLEQEVSAIASRMKLALWDPDAGTFRSRAWDGPMTDEVSATALLSLIGGMPSRTQMHQVVDYLSREFLAPYLIPTVGRSDSAFGDQLPWRGRVSALLNALICEGLRHFGQDDWAELITLSGLDLISKSWQEQRQVFAHYQAVTGTGDDIPQDPLAPAGMLFSALGIAMLIDVEPWDGMRLGNISGAELSVSGLELHGERYDLSSGPWGFSTVRNGDPWWEADRPIILRNLYQTDKEVSFHAKVGDSAPVRLRFYGYQPGTQVSVRVNGQLYTVVANEDGVVDFQANIPPTPRPGGGPGRMMT